jgi:hypothetical protein
LYWAALIGNPIFVVVVVVVVVVVGSKSGELELAA